MFSGGRIQGDADRIAQGPIWILYGVKKNDLNQNKALVFLFTELRFVKFEITREEKCCIWRMGNVKTNILKIGLRIMEIIRTQIVTRIKFLSHVMECHFFSFSNGGLISWLCAKLAYLGYPLPVWNKYRKWPSHGYISGTQRTRNFRR